MSWAFILLLSQSIAVFDAAEQELPFTGAGLVSKYL
jgi:hypothetical protein